VSKESNPLVRRVFCEIKYNIYMTSHAEYRIGRAEIQKARGRIDEDKVRQLEDLIDDAKTCQDLTDCMGASQRVRAHIKQAMKKFQERD
jgi:hypothetical protein